MDRVWALGFVEWNPIGIGGEIEIYAKNEDGKKDVTRPQPVT